MRSIIKAFFKSFIITFVAAMLFTIVDAAYQEVEKIWQELEIPYDIKSEYLIMAPLGTLQIKLTKSGIGSDSWIQKVIFSWRESQYEKAIKKIPEDDLIRIWFWYVYKLWPIISVGNYDPKDYVDDVMYVIEKSLTMSSKSEAISHAYRYFMISESLSLFSKNENFYLSDKQRLNKLLSLFKETQQKLKQGIKNCEQYNSCSTLFDTSYHILILEIDYANSKYKEPAKYCNHPDTIIIAEHMKELAIWDLKYNKQMKKERRKEKYYRNLIEPFKRTHKAFNDYIRKNCKYSVLKLGEIDE